jgi:S-adenosylmethionine/arginine decarboxylase-like enzyme
MNYVLNVLNQFITIENNIKKHHGNHVFADFIWDVEDNIDHNLLGKRVFEIMENAIKKTKMTIVHKKLCMLGETENSPPGFSSIILIDESHCSSHCYSDRGWLALDTFTCGNTDPKPIMVEIENEIKKYYPSLKCTYLQNHKRFHYN